MNMTPWLDGLGFTEGPVALRDGRVACTSNTTGRVYFVRDGVLEGELDVGGGATGLAEDAAGTVYLVQNRGFWGAPANPPALLGRIVDGRLEPVVDAPFTAPNDLCFGPDDRLYLSDPMAEDGLEKPVPGRVFAWDPATGEAELLSDDLLFPNGIAFDPADALHVAETFRARIVRLDGDGATHVVAETRDGQPDGMAFDAEGNLWAAVNASDAVQVFAPDGELVRRLDMGAGAYPSNVCFGGPDGTTLFVTTAGRGGLVAVDVGVRGLELHPFRPAVRSTREEH
jgi:gluconolactonase